MPDRREIMRFDISRTGGDRHIVVHDHGRGQAEIPGDALAAHDPIGIREPDFGTIHPPGNGEDGRARRRRAVPRLRK